jgi:hypothetical protein
MAPIMGPLAWPDCRRRSHASAPGVEMSEYGGNRAGRLVAQLMAADASVGLHVAQPNALIGHLRRHAVGGRAGEQIRRGTFTIEYQYCAG